MNKTYIISGLGLLFVLIIFIYLNNSSNEQPTVIQDNQNQISTNSDTVSDENMNSPTVTASPVNDETPLVPYSPENLAMATQDQGRAVLFFHANWCPTCKAAEAQFKANPDKIPANVTILKTDYDTETELKSKYGVVTQDTFIQVDSQGNAISKWNSGGQGIETLLSNIK